MKDSVKGPDRPGCPLMLYMHDNSCVAIMHMLGNHIAKSLAK